MKQTKTILSMLCAAALFAACSSTDELEPVVQAGEQAVEEAVGFDVYTRGSLPTRAGYVGEMDQTAIRVAGFGVYGYVTPGKLWTAAKTEAIPDFMSNQLVSYNSAKTAWEYAPLKYWPNQANNSTNPVDGLGGGTATNSDSPNDIDYVSFFAYAPYVANAPYKVLATAQTEAAKVEPANDGILYVHQNDIKGSPKVVYRMADNPVNSVDLMYGVAAHAYNGAARYTGKNDQDVVAGMPFRNMTKETVADKIDYRFLHALSKLSVNVDAYFDEVRNGTTPGTNDVDPYTRIVVENVILHTTQLGIGGTLDLENTSASTPAWSNVTKLSTLNTNNGYYLKNIIAPNLLYIGGNDHYVTHFAQQPLGVTKNKQSLLGYAVDGTTPASLMFVPDNVEGTNPFKVTVIYRVITRDTRLEDGYSEIINTITNTIADWDFQSGKAYTLNLHLGMTSVKFDATIADWENGSEEQIDLPANVMSLVVGAAVPSYGGTDLAVTAGTIQAAGDTPEDVTSTTAFTFVSVAGLTGSDVTFTSGTGSAAKFATIAPNYTNAERTLGILTGTYNSKIEGSAVITQPRMDFTIVIPKTGAPLKNCLKINGTDFPLGDGSGLRVSMTGDITMAETDIDSAADVAANSGSAKEGSITITHANGFSQTISYSQPYE